MHAITISVYQLRHSIRSKEQRTYQKLKRPLLQTIAGCTNVGGTRRAKIKLTRRNASPRHRNILETIRRDDCKVLIKQVLLTGLGKSKPKLQRKELRRPFALLGSSSSPRWYCDEFTDRNYNAAHVLYDHITMGGARNNFGTSDFFGSLHLCSRGSQCGLSFCFFVSVEGAITILLQHLR